MISTKTILKKNAIRLAKHHKKNCDGETCAISLYMIYELLKEAGINVTRDEMKHFV